MKLISLLTFLGIAGIVSALGDVGSNSDALYQLMEKRGSLNGSASQNATCRCVPTISTWYGAATCMYKQMIPTFVYSFTADICLSDAACYDPIDYDAHYDLLLHFHGLRDSQYSNPVQVLCEQWHLHHLGFFSCGHRNRYRSLPR